MELEMAKPDAEKEEELEGLRLELVSATERARRLFDEAAVVTGREEAEGGTILAPKETAATKGPGSEFRLRLVQMDMELDKMEAKLGEERRRTRELEGTIEGKEMEIARMMADCQRYRKMAFGDSDAEMRRIERQLEYR
jgi:hypothetical protein